MKTVTGGVCAPKGFKAAGIHCGVKAGSSPDKKDLALILSETECAAAAVYTMNRVKAAPLYTTMENLESGTAWGVVANSGNANACAPMGPENAEAMCLAAALATQRNSKDFIVASTGVIGQTLNIEVIRKAMPELAAKLSENGSDDAEAAIMSTDDRQAARCAMDSLIALGHRKFVIVGGDREVSDTSRLRYEGCMQSFRNHGIEYDEELDYQDVRFSYQDGYNATQQLIANGRKFTALFAIADVMAIGAIRALHNNGLRVPKDVSVMGFDGLRLGSFLVPELSTVIQSAQKMAQRSVEILIDRIEHGGHACHEAVPYALHQRESTRRIDDD